MQIEDSSNIELVKQLIQAHTYWRMKGLIVDLVIWNEDHGGYRAGAAKPNFKFINSRSYC
ncbi:MAG: hypothetical protein WDM90_07540 [Ferruginibacter sp.]